jgi:ATP/maltotriose-dependent transcriptional regulator MalT
MTMSFFLNADVGEFDNSEYSDFTARPMRARMRTKADDLPLLAEKLQVPETDNIVQRDRLQELLEKSRSSFAATLISGRAGTGKTVAAAEFARSAKNAAWYSVDPADCDWNVFSKYFTAAVSGAGNNADVSHASDVPEDFTPAAAARFLVDRFSTDGKTKREPFLVVLDNIHHLFDAEWFTDFFNLLLLSLNSEAHVVLICRSKPPSPLWRLRSKQVLNVIDEKVLAFTLPEAEEFCRMLRLPKSAARKVHGDTYGRISKLVQFFNAAAPKQNIH